MGNIKKFVEQFKELDSTKQHAIISKLEEVFEIQANPVLPYQIISLKAEISKLSKENSVLKKDVKHLKHRNDVLNQELKNLDRGKFSKSIFIHLWELLTEEERNSLKLEVTKSHYYSHIESRLNDYMRRLELLQEAHSNLLSAYVNSNKK